MKMEDPAVTVFRNYLKINTMQPNPDYSNLESSYFDLLSYIVFLSHGTRVYKVATPTFYSELLQGSSTAFLSDLAKDIGLEFKTIEVLPGKPFVVMTWPGENPALKSIMLHSHVDVVPVFPKHWKVDPFSAEKMENGDIIARGSQDMKCVAIQYLEAIRRLRAQGKVCLRTIHLTFSADEEIGSLPMAKFVQSDDFKQLNIGFALDEGIANPGSAFRVFYAERSMWWVKVTCTGRPGHGSQFIQNTAAEKLQKVINSFLQFRCHEEQRLKSDPKLTLGEVTTVNMTMLEGGVQINVVPAELSANFDIRVPPTVNLPEFENQIKTWCKEAGEGVTYSFIVHDCSQDITPNDKSDPWWNAFSTTLEKLGHEFTKEVFPAGTDSRYTRTCGIPALGFSPMNHTPILLHDHNEFLNEKIFLAGIDTYQGLIPALADVPQ